MLSSQGEQEMHALGCFISATGAMPTKIFTIDYYILINHTKIQYETVKELPRQSGEATLEIGQKHNIKTFKLGVCMKVLPLVLKYPERYRDHITLLGPFHTCINYIGMITDLKCLGSGFADIILEVKLVTSGYIRNVLSGKTYAKALFYLNFK